MVIDHALAKQLMWDWYTRRTSDPSAHVALMALLDLHEEAGHDRERQQWFYTVSSTAFIWQELLFRKTPDKCEIVDLRLEYESEEYPESIVRVTVWSGVERVYMTIRDYLCFYRALGLVGQDRPAVPEINLRHRRSYHKVYRQYVYLIRGFVHGIYAHGELDYEQMEEFKEFCEFVGATLEEQ